MDEFVLKTLENATAMTIVGLALLLLMRFMGQKTDPKLIELFEMSINAASKRDDDNRDTYNRLATALEVISGLMVAIPAAHQAHSVAIDAVPGKINPSIDKINDTIVDNTESVDTMNGKLEELVAKVEKLCIDMALVLKYIKQAKEESEAPTEPIAPVIDPGEPSIGKLKTVGKPSIGITPTSSATYPDKIEEETTS